MNSLKRLCGSVLFFFLIAGSTMQARAQSNLENVLKHLSSDVVKGYIKPIGDQFLANMNAGMYHSAHIPVTGLGLQIEIIGMGSIVSDEQKTYDIVLPAGFVVAPGTSLKTATIFGGKGTLFKDAPGGIPSGLEFRGSDGIINSSLFPLAVPQLRVGYIFGTEAMIRFVTSPSIGDNKFPKTTLFGAGVRHNVGQYIPALPLDIAVGVFYNTFAVGDLISMNSVAFGAQAGKKFAILSIFGGLQYEKGTMNITYTTAGPTPQSLNIDLDAKNTFRATVGADLSLGFFSLFADANFGTVTNFSAGLGIGI
jgi:hypothetical protein